MLKKRLKGKTLGVLAMMLMVVCLSLFAGLRSKAWTVNPANYRYDMSLYFKLSAPQYEDLSLYEIGAFVGDQCRGLAEKVELPDGGSCLNMRIRSNDPAGSEEVTFRLLVKANGNVINLTGETPLIFKADEIIGMPSAPYVLRPYYNVSIVAGEHGSVEFESGLYVDGTVLTVDAVPDEGYHFDAWSDGNKNAKREITVNGNIELEATFAVSVYSVTFMIDGEVYETRDIAYGETIVAPQSPEKEGYTFSGWSNFPATMPAENLVVSGSFAINQYTLTFTVDGNVYHTAILDFGAPIDVPDAPYREDAVFSGWGEVPSTMPAHDLTIGGTFAGAHYKLVFKIDEVVYVSSEMAYGAEISVPTAPEKEGYTFAGWGDVPATMPGFDLEFDSTYHVNYYKVTFLIDNEVVYSSELPYGSEVMDLAAPEKHGYSFAGWVDVPATMPAHDIEINGSYVVNVYHLTYMIDGETFFTTQLPYGSEIVPIEADSREGYTFSGWGEVPSTMPAYDLVLNGTYSVGHYTLTFKIDDLVIFTGMLPYGSSITSPEAPEKTGHAFLGWDNVPETMPAHDLEIIGAYEALLYDLIFIIDDEVYYSTQLPYGGVVAAPEVVAPIGKTFSGWGPLPEWMPAYNMTVVGTYSLNHYTLTFMIDGEVVFTAEMPYGSHIIVPEGPEKEGYTFIGWDNVPEVMPAENLEFNAGYEVNFYNVVFIADGEVVATDKVAFGAEIPVPAAPEKEGYTFDDWGVVPATMPAHDLEFIAEYDINVYNLTFKIDDEVLVTAQVPFGAELSVPHAPEKEGYTFAGWGFVPATMPAHDLMVSSTYNVNVYKLVYKVDGEVISASEVEYGSQIEVPEVAEKEGYTFSGWGMIPETMPAGDLEFNGSYTLNHYMLTFKLDGELVYMGQLAFGMPIIAPEIPEKEGYTFSGWGEVPATMPAKDLEFEGAYDVNYYRLTVYLNNEVYLDEELPYGAKIEIADPEVGDDETFNGWQEDIPETMPAHDLTIYGTTTGMSAIGELLWEGDQNVTVSNLNGMVLYNNVKWSNVKSRLQAGIYLINGRKVIIYP